MKSSLKLALFVLITVLFIEACGTSSLSVRDPHVYLNSFEEVISSVNEALNRAEMNVKEAERVDDNTYFVRYFQSGYDVNEYNPESVLTADLTIKRLGENRTEVIIREEDQPDMIPGEFRLHLARDLYRELNPMLTLEPQPEN